MVVRLTDDEIEKLLRERKILPADFRQRLSLKAKRGHKERELDVIGESGSEFRILLRQSDANPLNFSVILAYRVPGSNQFFRLRRYNGSHEHTNRLEGVRMDDFHVHTATERYQDSGLREDAFASPSDRYADLPGALDCLLQDCGFEVPGRSQFEMF